MKSLLVFLLILPLALAGYWEDKPVMMWPYKEMLIMNDGKAGGVNVQKTVEAMNDAGVTGFTFGVRSESDIPALRSKLELFKDTDIQTTVITTGKCVFWEDQDCPTAVKMIAEVANEYPNLKVFCMDDYHPLDPNKIAGGLTPDHLRSTIDAKNTVNPELYVVPTIYLHDEIKVFRDAGWKDEFRDGTTMWYYPTWKSGANPTYAEFKSLIDEAKPLIPVPWMPGIYTLHVGDYQRTMDVDDLFHDPTMLYNMAKYSMENADGLGLFSFPLFAYDMEEFKKASVFKQVANDRPADYDYMLNLKEGIVASWYQEIKATVPVGGTKNVRVTFDVEDTYSRTDDGTLFMQLLVNDDVVWEEDAESVSGRHSVDKTVSVSAANAKIQIRYYVKEIANLGHASKMYIDNPTVRVNGNPVTANWAWGSGLTHEQEYIDTYNAIKNGIKGASPPPPLCGNGMCNSGECVSCKKDCNIADCDDDGECLSGYKDGDETCSSSADCVCIQNRTMLGNWTMERVGDKVMDRNGSRHLSIVGQPDMIEGVRGYALRFNGEDYLQIPDESALDTEQMTFMAWIRPDMDMEGTFRAVAAKADEDASDWSWQLRFTPDSHLGLQLNTDSGRVWAMLDQGLQPGVWYHLAARYDGTQACIYLDGEQISCQPAANMKKTDSSFYIGHDGWSNNFIGGIDEAALFAQALDEDDIALEAGEEICYEMGGILNMISGWKEDRVRLGKLIGTMNTWTQCS